MNFVLDEVLEIKGFLFKVVLIDGLTGKIGLKQISPEEAKFLKKKTEEASTAKGE